MVQTKSTQSRSRFRNKFRNPFRPKHEHSGGSEHDGNTGVLTDKPGREQQKRSGIAPEETKPQVTVMETKRHDFQTGNSSSHHARAPSASPPLPISTGLHSRAFQSAYQTLDLVQQQHIKLLESRGQQKAEDIFVVLSEENDKHKSMSWFRKGLTKVSSLTVNLKFCLDLASPLTALDPSATLAAGVVKSVASLTIGLCGVSDQLDDQLSSILAQLPIIQKCDNAIQDRPDADDIEYILGLLYKDLLKIYFEIYSLITTPNFAVAAIKSQYQGQITSSAKAFAFNAKHLSLALDVAVYSGIVSLLSNQEEEMIRKCLRDQKEDEFIDTLERQAEGTCEWITQRSEFVAWLENVRCQSRCITLLGDPGSGKTVTTTFVTQYLRGERRISTKRTQIDTLCHYCKDDGERNKVVNVYRSLLWQLLHFQPYMKRHFVIWLEKRRQEMSTEPTASRDELKAILQELFLSSARWLVIVLDALDECQRKDQLDILSTVKSLLDQCPSLRIFVSSRYNIPREEMPESTTYLDMESSKEMDHKIAAYLASRYLSVCKAGIREAVITRLSERANGSAIWIKMVLQYLEMGGFGESMIDALDDPPSQLTRLYGKMFLKATAGSTANQRIVKESLEIIATAERPMTLLEVACMVTLGKPRTIFRNLAHLKSKTDWVRVLALLRPFIRTRGYEHSLVSLTHQSLKELVLSTDPDEWSSELDDDHLIESSRTAAIHERTANHCIKYLMFEEINQIELTAKGQIEYNEALFNMSMLVMDDEEIEEMNRPDDDTKLQDFDPSTRGLGDLFNYAACYWPQHVSNSASELVPDAQIVLDLARPGSIRLRNWSQQYRWPSSRIGFGRKRFLPDENCLDALAVAVHFRWNKVAIQLLEQFDEDPDNFTRGSIDRVTEWALDYGQFSLVQEFLQRVTAAETTNRIFRQAMRKWHMINSKPGEPGRPLTDDGAEEWTLFFIHIVKQRRSYLMGIGPWILTEAARLGCLRMVKVLLQADSLTDEFRQAVLGDGGVQWAHNHLFVGEAAFWSHLDVVDFLCRQDGIGTHLRHLGPDGDTVYHAAARSDQSKILQTLFKHWPEAIDQRSNHDRPLARLVFNRPRGADPIEGVNFLLSVGRADPNALDSLGGTALAVAVGGGSINLIRTLVEAGADIGQVLGRRDDGTPYLKVQSSSPTLGINDKILDTLCSLEASV